MAPSRAPFLFAFSLLGFAPAVGAGQPSMSLEPTDTVALTGTEHDEIFSNGFEPTDLTPWSHCVGCLDNDAPETIVDLIAGSGGEPGAVELSWTAPAEDSFGSGPCSSYELRISVSDITDESSWENANDYPLLLMPSAPGNGQFLTVTGLEPGQLYYFALRAFDEVANRGALGPSASAIATPE